MRFFDCFATLLLVPLLAVTSSSASDGARRLQFTYEVTLPGLEAGAGPLHVFVPLARTGDDQTVHAREVTASFPGSVATESAHGNEFWHGVLQRSDGADVTISVDYDVEIRPRHRRRIDFTTRKDITAKNKRRHAIYLKPNALVPVDDPVLAPILADIRKAAGSDDKSVISRSIYDWLVTNMEYKKVGTGWGNGDTFWACSERYGNCTDFHSLFNSLARTEGIPSRFDIGFPIPTHRSSGTIGGYHCWAQVFLPGTDWIPIDASEAFKHPEKRELFYGGHEADRIHFTTGRDLDLGRGHLTGKLNYFIYPHVELSGQPYEGAVTTKFSFAESAAAVSGQ